MPVNTGTAVRELKIGPYAGGINTYSDVSAISDDELADCVNFDIDLDGSMKSRPPWELLTSDSILTGGPDRVACFQEVLITGTYETIQFIIVTSNHEGLNSVYVYYIDGPNAGDLLPIANGIFSRAHRYDNNIFLIPGRTASDTQGGVKYVLDTGLVTSIPTMPKGDASAIYKDRLWISGRRNVARNSRLYFSELVDWSIAWPASNFFDINPGDGDALNDMIVYQDNLMLFKDSATYVLSYDSGPAQAVLQAVNMDVGVQDSRSVVAYENSLFLMQYNVVFEMQNYDFTRVSVKVPFQYDPSTPDTAEDQEWKFPRWLRLCGDRLIARFYNRLYVYHLRLRAWTRWDSEDPNIAAIGPIVQLDSTNTNSDSKLGHNSYVATSSLLVNIDSEGPGEPLSWNLYFKIFRFQDYYGDSEFENGNITPASVDIKCSLTTKAYDIGVSHRFKRLMHWGVDTITGRTITGTIFPFTIAYKVTWAQLHIYHWHELNTWGYPLFKIPSIEQAQPIGAGIARRYIRFPKSLRFRLVQFKVDMLTIGNKSDGPARLYSITAFVGGKQLAPKAVN